jgi:hypothetical protein
MSDLKSCVLFGRTGSIPVSGTKQGKALLQIATISDFSEVVAF